MSNITSCKVLTKSDENEKEELVVYTEWDDLKATIFIMRSDESLLKGEILLEDFNKYAKTFDKTLEAYVHETRSFLSGDNNDIEFLLKDNKFSWKRKRWCLGQIPVTSDTQVECLRKFTVILMDEHFKSKKETGELKKNNATLINRCSALEEQIKEMIALKQQLEQTIYKQCLLVLNTKKDKIRSLRRRIKKDHKDPIFDVTTDESDNDVDFKDKSPEYSSQLNKFHAEKRKVVSASNENKMNDTVRKKRKSENSEKIDKGLRVEIGQKDIEPVASTSKLLGTYIYTDTSTKDTELNFKKTENLNSNIGEDDETPDLFDNGSCKSDGDESECEVQLQFDEEKFDDNEKKECAINEDNSEEEMF